MNPDWHADTVEVDGLRLHYTRTGGTTPLIAAHGVGDDGLCWTALATALAPEYDVIMVDARGHGRSDAPSHGYTPALQAADLVGVIKALGLDHPIILGHSMGAVTTLALASMWPELPRAILLEDPPPWWMPHTQTPTALATRGEMSNGMAALKRTPHAELVAGQRAAAPHWPAAEIERWATSKQRFSHPVLGTFAENPAAGLDWAEALPRIQCPALLLTADPAHGALVRQDDAAALQRLVPQVTIAHIAGGGHSIRHDRPDEYLAAVRTFLARV